MPGGWADRNSLSKGANGRNLCRWCSLEVPPGRHTFCSDWCVAEWRVRTDPGYVRERVLQRDQGVCAQCGVDCVAAWKHLKRLRGIGRLKALADWGLRSGSGVRKSLWDADHILPVVEGGGECDLENIRTLCLKCHRLATAQLLEKRRATGKTNADPKPTDLSADARRPEAFRSGYRENSTRTSSESMSPDEGPALR